MVCSVLVGLPVQTHLGGAKHLAAVHAHVVDTGLRVSGDDQRECHERSSIFWPSSRYRQPSDIRFLHDYLLTGPSRDFARRHRHALPGKTYPSPWGLEYTTDVGFHQSDHALADLLRFLNAERSTGPFSRSVQVHQQWKLADTAVR